MRTVNILDNSLFDDGSIDCLNFWLADDEGTRLVDSSLIRTLGLESRVNEAISQGKSYIETRGLVYAGLQILEIQWG